MTATEPLHDQTLPTIARWTLWLGFWGPLGICTWLALVPDPPDNVVFRLGDVVLHMAAFTYLTLALGVARYRVVRTRGGSLASAGLVMFAYGILIELAQMLIPERTAEAKDLLVDGFGILLGLLAVTAVAPRLHALIRTLSGSA